MTIAAFFGTPAAAVPSLAALTEVADVALVITQPDARKGRGEKIEPSPIRAAADEWGLNVVQPATSIDIEASLREFELDVAVVAAYGRLLPRAVLATTRTGFVNVHFSLLPRWRGASPVASAILAGDDVTGVSIMVLDEGLDTGPVVAVRETSVEPTDTTGVLTARLSAIGGRLLAETLDGYLAGARRPAPQFEGGATAAPRLTTRRARLDSLEGRTMTLRKVRAYNPKPGAWIIVDGERIKVWGASSSDEPAPIGRVVSGARGPLVGLLDGAIALDNVQPAGKRHMPGAAWWRGRREDEATVDPAIG